MKRTILLKKILHHGSDNGCGDFCCTKIENFSVTLGELKVFENVNLHIHCGELTAIIGANGAGKSTFLRAILGEIPHGGKLSFVDAKGKKTKKPVIGYVPQQLLFDKSAPMSVLDLFAAAFTEFPVWFYTKNSVRERAKAALKRAQAEHLINRRLGALSGGELQRALLSLALEPLPNLLLLDEPVSGVDFEGRELFYETVTKLRETEDIAIILVSHDLEMLSKYADKVALLNRGLKIVGSPEEVFASEEFKKVFGKSEV